MAAVPVTFTDQGQPHWAIPASKIALTMGITLAFRVQLVPGCEETVIFHADHSQLHRVWCELARAKKEHVILHVTPSELDAAGGKGLGEGLSVEQFVKEYGNSSRLAPAQGDGMDEEEEEGTP